MTTQSRRRARLGVAVAAGLTATILDAKLTYADQNPNDQTVFLNANDASAASSFNSGTNWQTSTSAFSTSPYTNPTVLPAGTAPTPGYAYVVTGSTAGTGLLRTPTTGNPTFAGDSLTIEPFVANTNLYNVNPVATNYLDTTALLTLSGAAAQTTTISNLVLANGGTVKAGAAGLAVLAGNINLVPAGITLNGITTTLSGGSIDGNMDANGVVVNSTLSGSGMLHIFSANGSSGSTFVSLNSSNPSFTGGFLIDDTPGSSAAGSVSYPLVNINSPTALGTGTLTFGALPGSAIQSYQTGPSIDNTSGVAETLTTNPTQQWNGSFTFKGTNALNLGSGAVTVQNNMTVTVTAGTLTEAGAITSNGGSTLTIGGSGTFELTQASLITTNGVPVNVSGGSTLALPANATTAAGYAAFAGVPNFIAGSYLGVDTTGITGAYNLSSAMPAGVYGLRKIGPGTLLVSNGSNAYTGPTNVSTGTLQVGNPAALSSSGNIQLSSGTFLDLNGNSTSLQLLSGTGNVINSTTTPVTLTLTNGGSPAYSGVIANGGSSAATSLVVNLPAGNAFNMASASNTYTGSTNLSGGTLIVGAASLSASDHVVFNGGILGFSVQPTVDPSVLSSTVNGNPYSFNVASSSLNISLAGPFTGTAGLSKVGAGIVTLTGLSNTYTGVTNINGGTLAITNPVNLGQTSGVVVTTGALNMSSATNYTLGVGISGAGNFVKAGTDILTLSGNNSYTGTTSVIGGTLKVGSANAITSSGNVAVATGTTLVLNGYSLSLPLVSGAGTVTNSTATPVTLTINTGGATAFTGNISNGAFATNTTSLVVNLPTGNSFTMTGATNTYTGSTTLTGGTLFIGPASLTKNDPILFNGGTLGFGGVPNNDPSTNFTAVGGNPFNFNVASGVTVTLGTSLTDGSNGPTALNLSGSGTLILSGTTTYTGATTIMPSANSFATLGFATPAAIPPSMQSGITVALNTSAGIGNNTSSFAFAIPVSGPGGFTKLGSDTVTLNTTNNTYTGSTNVSQGVLVLGNATALGSSSYTNLGANGVPNGTLDLNGNNVTLTQPTGGGNGGVITNSNASSASVLTLVPSTDSSAASSAYLGAITGNLSLIVNFGATGVEPLYGVAASPSTYTGTTTLQSGVLAINRTTNLPSTPQSIVFAGGSLELALAGADPSPSFNQSAGQNFNILVSSTGTLASPINSSGGSLTLGNLAINAVGTLILSGANNYSGPTTVVNGVLQIANAKAIAQTSGVTVNSYLNPAIGSTVVNGVLTINDSSGAAGLTGGVAGGAPIPLTLNGLGNSTTITQQRTVAGRTSNYPVGIGYYGALQGTANANDTWAGNIVLGSAPVGISGGFGTFSNTSSGGTLNLTGVISGTGPLVLGANSNSVTVLANANTYTGETQITSALGAKTIIQLGANNGVPAASGLDFAANVGPFNSSATFPYQSATFDLNGFNTSTAYVTGNGPTVAAASIGIVTNNLNGSTGTLTILGAAPAPYSGVYKDGSATAKLALAFNASGQVITTTGINQYSGGTTINSGTIIVPTRATIGTGNITINGGATFLQNFASGTAFSQLQSGYDRGVAYWAGPGINSTAAAGDTSFLTAVGSYTPTSPLAIDGQTLNPTDVLLVYTYYGDANLDGKVDGSDYSLIDNGFAAQGGTSPLTGWQNGDFNYDGVIDGSDYTLIDNAFNNQGGTISQAALVAASTDLVAAAPGTSAVPEPATVGLLAVAAAGLLGRRRRV